MPECLALLSLQPDRQELSAFPFLMPNLSLSVGLHAGTGSTQQGMGSDWKAVKSASIFMLHESVGECLDQQVR